MKAPIAKSISALALLASSSSAYALMPPNLPVYKACIAVSLSEAGAASAEGCDQTANNKKLELAINPETGCAAGQASLRSHRVQLQACAAEAKAVDAACTRVYTSESGAMHVSDCDQTANNEKLKKELHPETGCAEGQAKFTSYSVDIPACMPVGVVQL